MQEKSSLIAHVAANNGSCKRGFVKNLVNMAAEVAPALKISHDDINNTVRRIRDPPEQQQQEVSPAIPYHAIVCPTLSTDSDSSISADLISERTSAENPLDILANQAAVMLEPTSRCTVSTQVTLPNRCLYEECGAPLNLVPKHCSSCLRLVHRNCQQFWFGRCIGTSMLLCPVCHDEESDIMSSSDASTTAPATAAQVVRTTQEVRDNARAAYERLQAAQAMLYTADAEEEEDHLILSDNPTETRNKGGRPKGSTIEHSQAQELARKQAVNHVVVKYAALQEEREKEGKKRLESGIREKLIETAIQMFRIEGKFDVPKQTIFNRIALDRLEVWHPGTESPLLEVEVILISFILTAHRLCCPLDVGDVIALMNALISETSHEKRLIAWKKITVVTTRIPHRLATTGSEISATEIHNSGPLREKSMHETAKITVIIQNSK